MSFNRVMPHDQSLFELELIVLASERYLERTADVSALDIVVVWVVVLSFSIATIFDLEQFLAKLFVLGINKILLQVFKRATYFVVGDQVHNFDTLEKGEFLFFIKNHEAIVKSQFLEKRGSLWALINLQCFLSCSITSLDSSFIGCDLHLFCLNLFWGVCIKCVIELMNMFIAQNDSLEDVLFINLKLEHDLERALVKFTLNKK